MIDYIMLSYSTVEPKIPSGKNKKVKKVQATRAPNIERKEKSLFSRKSLFFPGRFQPTLRHC